MMRFLVALAGELLPSPTVTEAGDPGSQALEEEIAGIERRMKTDRRGYFRDDKMQARYRELVAARERRGVGEAFAGTSSRTANITLRMM